MRKKTTRQLVRNSLKARRVTANQVDQFFRLDRSCGWVANFNPQPEDYDRPVVRVRSGHLMAQVLSETFLGQTRYSVGDLENLIGVEIDTYGGCRELARYGLAMLALEREGVVLVGTNPGLANIVNSTRRGFCRSGYRTDVVVQEVLGLVKRPQRITEEARLRSAERLETFHIDGASLLNMTPRVHLFSKWLLNNLSNDQLVEEG